MHFQLYTPHPTTPTPPPSTQTPSPRSSPSNIALKRRIRRLERQYKRAGHNIRACGARVGMIIRIITIHRRGAGVLEQVRRVQAVVDEGAAGDGGGRLAVADEAIRAVRERARLPRIVGRRGAEDYGRALCVEELRCVHLVGRVG